MSETLKASPAPADAAEVSEKPMFNAEEYERLLDMYDVSFKNFAEGEVVRGVVLRVGSGEAIVDIGYKSEGIIPLAEFTDLSGQVTIKQATPSTFCSSGPRTRTATSSCRRKKPRR